MMIHNPSLTFADNLDKTTNKKWPFVVTHVNGRYIIGKRRRILAQHANNYDLTPFFGYTTASGVSYYSNYNGTKNLFEVQVNNTQYLIDRNNYKVPSRNFVEITKDTKNNLIETGKTYTTQNGSKAFILNFVTDNFVSEPTFIALISQKGSKDELARYNINGKILSHGQHDSLNLRLTKDPLELTVYNWIDCSGAIHTETTLNNHIPSTLSIYLLKHPKHNYTKSKVLVEYNN